MKGLLLIGLVGVGAALLMKDAHASTVSNTRMPAGWVPPADATVVKVETGLGFPVHGATWTVAPGQQMLLWWDPTDPETFVGAQVTRAPNGNEMPNVLAVGANANSRKLVAVLKANAT